MPIARFVWFSRFLPSSNTVLAQLQHSGKWRSNAMSRSLIKIVAMFVLVGTMSEPAFAQNSGALPSVNLTIKDMVRQADWVVKAVLTILLFASVGTLAIWIQKTWELISNRRSIVSGIDRLTRTSSLGGVAEIGDATIDAMVSVAKRELQHRPAGTGRHVADGVKERAVAQIQRIEAARQRRLSRGVSVLGSVGAAAPFVGLFGTVWGIMNSFIGIANTQTTNLAVVAPGIAEALLTTGIGLVAAIPAVLVFNGVTRAIGGYRIRMNDAAVQVMCLLSRDLDADVAETPQPRKAGGLHGV